MKMKKRLAVLLTLAIVMSMSACGQNQEEEKPATYEIAMISDSASIEDGSFNEAVWDGIEDFVSENPVSYKYYLTTENTTDAYLRTIGEAIDGGAKIVIAAGAAFDEAIYESQSQYPKTSFVLLDGQPQGGGESAVDIRKNTVAVTFAEDQAGYLAGYAAVKEGYENLGFAGGKEIPPVERFGYGFVMGAGAAAKEEGRNIAIKYKYTGSFDESAAIEKMASDWYHSGTEVIFSCAGGAGISVMKAAEAAGGKVIGVDVDQGKASKTVLVSAVKNIASAISDILGQYYGDHEFAGGECVVLNAQNAGIGLSMDSSRMKRFDKDAYNKTFNQLAAKQVVLNPEKIKTVKDLETDQIKIELVK